jgi:SAM-dependent methyltransferase
MPFVAHRVFGWTPVTIDESWGLATLKSGQAYSICNSLTCDACGHLFLDIRFTEEEMARLYDDYRGEAYTALREQYEPGYRARNQRLNNGTDYVGEVEKFLEPHLEFPAAVLDWGGDTGINTPFQGRGSLIHIFDISGKTPAHQFRCVGLSEARSTHYDLIVCSHVLEHVPFPLALLADINTVLHPDTLLYIEVPYEDLMRKRRLEPQLRKRHWHEHINFFSEESLAVLLEQAGLHIVATRTLEAFAGGSASVVFQAVCRRRVH